MSTRAIIGVKNQDGTITGAWNWNDGYDIKNDLLRDFRGLEDVQFLLQLGMFNTIYSIKEYEDFVAWAAKERIDISHHVFTSYKKSVISQDQRHIGRAAENYSDLINVLGQDINVAYIYEDGRWKTYK